MAELNTDVENPEPEIWRTVIPYSVLTKKYRKEIGRWLIENLGKPDRKSGVWWTDDTTDGLQISFRLQDAHVAFVLIFQII